LNINVPWLARIATDNTKKNSKTIFFIGITSLK